VHLIVAAAIALLSSVALAGEARAADGSTGTTGLGIKLPSVEVKLAPVEIKVPSVEVNLSPVEVQVPSVEVKLPPVDVKLPPVEATVPPLDVKVPQVEAPAPPRNQAPPASAAPQAPSGGGAPPASPARRQDARAHETSHAGAPAPATSGDAAVRGRAAPGGSATRRDPTSPTQSTRVDSPGDRAVPPAIRRRERRLRDLVRSLSGCLGALRSIETRVLILRAGGPTRPPLSRRQVARRLDVGIPRVAAVERRGLDRLREQARGGGCGGQLIPAVAVVAADTGTAPPSTMPATSPPPRSESRDRVGVVEAITRSLGGATATRVTPFVLLDRATGPPLLLLLIGGFLAGFALNWVRQSRAGGVTRGRAREAPG
jgi:hypothetical protein